MKGYQFRIGRGELFVAAATMFSFAAVTQHPVASALAGVLGLVFALAGLRSPQRSSSSLVAVAGALSLAVLLLTRREAMAQLSVWAPSSRIWLPLAAMTGLTALVTIRRPKLAGVVGVLAIATALAATLMVLVPHWTPAEASDIYRVHVAAGEAISAGLNPYSDAVTFESGNPFKPEGSEVIGYPYPTVPLVAYAGAAAFTDPRVVSALAWLGLLGWLAWQSRKSESTGTAALAALVILSTTPIWRFALFMSWTEPLSIAIFAGALWLWRKRRDIPAVALLGLGLASKQYFVFLAPALMVLGDGSDRRRGWQSLAIAGAITALPVLLGPSQYLDAIVRNGIDIGFRPDTQSFNGLLAALGSNWVVPLWLWGPAVLAFSIWLGRTVGSRERFAEVIVVLMSSVFLLSYAFPNYWLFVVAMAALTPVIDAGGAWRGAPVRPDIEVGSVS